MAWDVLSRDVLSYIRLILCISSKQMFQIASFKIICIDSTKILFSQILLKSFFLN